MEVQKNIPSVCLIKVEETAVSLTMMTDLIKQTDRTDLQIKNEEFAEIRDVSSVRPKSL